MGADEDGGMLNTGWDNRQQFNHNRGDSKESKLIAFDRVLNYKTDTIGSARTSISEDVAELIPVLMQVKDDNLRYHWTRHGIAGSKEMQEWPL